jgi:hypothetical protein
MSGYGEIEYEDGEPAPIRVKISQKRVSIEEITALQNGADRERIYEIMARFVLADDGNYATRCIVNRLGERSFPGIEDQIARLRNADPETFNSAVESMVAGLKAIRQEAVPLATGDA